MVRVVVPTPDVADKLVEIERAAFAGRETPWSADDYLAIGGPPGAAILVDDTLSNALLVMQFAADEGEVLNLGVVPAARRRGLGRELLEHGIALASTLGIARLFLEVAVDNGAAIALYRGAGFTEVGRRPDYYLRPDKSRVDALVLSLDVAQT